MSFYEMRGGRFCYRFLPVHKQIVQTIGSTQERIVQGTFSVKMSSTIDIWQVAFVQQGDLWALEFRCMFYKDSGDKCLVVASPD